MSTVLFAAEQVKNMLTGYAGIFFVETNIIK